MAQWPNGRHRVQVLTLNLILTLTPTLTLTLTLSSGAPPGLLVGGELGGLAPSPKPAAQGGPRSLDEVSAAAVARWETRPTNYFSYSFSLNHFLLLPLL